jgi:hypothetical protein
VFSLTAKEQSQHLVDVFARFSPANLKLYIIPNCGSKMFEFLVKKKTNVHEVLVQLPEHALARAVCVG